MALVLASAAAGGLAYWAARPSVTADYTSVAKVYHAALPGRDSSRLARQVAAHEDPRLRAKLRIAAATARPDEVGLSFIYTDAYPGQAAVAANRAAQSYADALRAWWETRLRRQRMSLGQATRRAEQTLLQADASLEQARRRQAAAEPRPDATAVPAMLDNPEWAAATSRLAALRSQREQLLISRTPLHPEVQYVSLQIAELEQDVARLPRQIANPKALGINSAPKPAVVTAAPSARELAALEAAVAVARADCDRARQAEVQAAQLPSAAIRIEVAQPVEMVAQADVGRPLWFALATGLMTALGLALVARWAAGQRLAVDAATLEACLGVPVLGVVKAEAK